MLERDFTRTPRTRSCDIGTYHKLVKECNPDEYFGFVTNEIVPSIEEYSHDSAEEVKRWVRCTSSWLKRYMKFATGCMSDRELERFYYDTIKMIDEGIRARKWQKELVDDQLSEADELYSNGLITDDEYEEIKWTAREVKKSLDDDARLLKDLKRACLSARGRIGAVYCIEKVANTTHSRGSMLPVMCGAYLPEDIISSVTGEERWSEFARPEDAGLELSQAVPKILECVKEFR